MKLERGDLCHGRQPFDAVDLKVGLAVARDRHELEEIGRTRHGMALKELLAADAIGNPDDRARASFDMAHHPRPDSLEIACEVELGHRFAVTGIRPQRLLGLGDEHAHDDGLCTGRLGFLRSGRCRIGYRHISSRRGRLGFDLGRRLVLAQPLEGRLANHAVACPACEFDLGDELGL